MTLILLLRERYLSLEGGLYGLIYGRCSRRDATSVEKTRRLRSFGYDLESSEVRLGRDKTPCIA